MEDKEEELLKISAKLQHRLEEKYNASQFKAIQKARKAEGITLIQGPRHVPDSHPSDREFELLFLGRHLKCVSKINTNYFSLRGFKGILTPGTGKSTTILGIISVLLNSVKVDRTVVDMTKLEDSEESTLPLYLRSSFQRGKVATVEERERRKRENLAKIRGAMPWVYEKD